MHQHPTISRALRGASAVPRVDAASAGPTPDGSNGDATGTPYDAAEPSTEPAAAAANAATSARTATATIGDASRADAAES